MKHELVGRRVKLIEAKDLFPIGTYEAEERGTITYFCDRTICIKLDKVHESLRWCDNELHWDEYSYDNVVEEFLNQVELI